MKLTLYNKPREFFREITRKSSLTSLEMISMIYITYSRIILLLLLMRFRNVWYPHEIYLFVIYLIVIETCWRGKSFRGTKNVPYKQHKNIEQTENMETEAPPLIDRTYASPSGAGQFQYYSFQY